MSNEQKWTPEPWKVDKYGSITANGRDTVLIQGAASSCSAGPSRDIGNANRDRVIACVNACAGMDDPAAEIAKLRRDLEANIESRHMEGAAFNKCLHLRDELSAALRKCLDICHSGGSLGWAEMLDAIEATVDAALAKVRP